MADVKIGLETHVQLDTKTKLFCSCPNEESEEPNNHVCETCLGHPGSKPRLNEEVVNQAVKASEALDCNVNEDVFFSRKTYFYPDMSKNYQITQYEVPVGENGEKLVKVGDEEIEIGIKRIHIEEDPAKMKHVGGNISDSDYTKVDYNRAGTPLIEIVTKPDFTSAEQARAYLQQLAKMLQYLELYHPDSNYSIKSDANISIDGGQRVEVKNITGTSEVEKALNYEISRQKQLKKRGKEVEQQTRSFNSDLAATESLRQKETEEDYGYIFDPDLTRQYLDEELRKEIKNALPELPREKFERFREEYGLKDKLVESLITESQLADDFENLADSFDSDLVASWMTGDLKKVLNYNELSYEECDLDFDSVNYILELISDDKISDRNAEMLLREVVGESKDPEQVVEDEDLLKAEDDEITGFVETVIEENTDAVEDFEDGDEEAVNFLVGQVMQQSGGKADPKTAREKILDQLE